VFRRRSGRYRGKLPGTRKGSAAGGHLLRGKGQSGEGSSDNPAAARGVFDTASINEIETCLNIGASPDRNASGNTVKKAHHHAA
jgi:hypothetical protein